ncbi:MAG TPA: serine/threonine-protein kinase [Candidatus Bathyarchaeia archaeon]|nr:serine/threonine-protein kinase [Candidatus Bathyarchaeia archaeon]
MNLQSFVPEEVEAALGRRYTVGSNIASGGQGSVFRATRTSKADGTATTDPVALKLHFDPRQAGRVIREVTALENLSHRNLARLIEHGYCYVAGRKTHYIAYEFIEGLSLRQRLKAGKLLESEILPIARDISAAIAALWSHRIVHGDIKPANIMLRESGDAVLIDLGILRFFEEDSALKPLRPVGSFAPEQVRPWGTVGYLSPEQARGEKLTCASDIYSLGVVLVECLQGWHPTNNDQNALANGIKASGRRLDVSPGLLSILDKMLLPVPRTRGRLAKLSGYFQMLHQRIEEEFAKDHGTAHNLHG